MDAAEDMGFLFPTRKRTGTPVHRTDDVHMLGVAKRWLELGIPRDLGRLYRESLEEISQMQVEAFNRVDRRAARRRSSCRRRRRASA